MKYHVLIYSGDAVFARMLELEFSMLGLQAMVAEHPVANLCADVVLLDLDSASAPSPNSYRCMIGFTRGGAASEDEARRACSMILRRPFEMRMLRREVLAQSQQQKMPAELPPMGKTLTLDEKNVTLYVDGHGVKLTYVELLVIKTLMDARGAPVSREQLSLAVGESKANKVDVYICYLRRKLEKLTPVKMIRTVRGKGYQLL